MFIPNGICFIRRVTSTKNIYGDRVYKSGPQEKIKYALIHWNTSLADSLVRNTSSVTRGNVEELQSTGRILVLPNVKPSYEDIFIINGYVFKAKQIWPRYSVLGNLDHYQIDLVKTDNTLGDGI